MIFGAVRTYSDEKISGNVAAKGVTVDNLHVSQVDKSEKTALNITHDMFAENLDWITPGMGTKVYGFREGILR